MIPKIIWQTHNFYYDHLPNHLYLNTKTWQNLNPGWEYKYCDHNERQKMVKELCPEIYDSYLKIWEPMYEADVWRYIVVQKFGGVYADIDSICIKPLDYMLSNYSGEDLIRTKSWNNWPRWDHGLVNNANFAAVKESNTLKKIIDFLLSNQANNLEPITWIAFSKEAKKNSSMFFDAALHAQELKSNFYDFEIDYYGQIIMYSNFLSKYSNLSELEIQNSSPKTWIKIPDYLPKASDFLRPKIEIQTPYSHTMNETFNM